MTVDEMIRLALEEDLGNGDITSEAIIPGDSLSDAIIFAKEKGVVCGVNLVKKVFHTIDSDLDVEIVKNDGEIVHPGETICRISGSTRAILAGERVGLNFLGHLSGIASKTHRIVQMLSSTKIRILDTRKTLPLYRKLQKYAVKTGGGENHRFGLFDMFLIKENHIEAAGSISDAIKKALSYRTQKGKNWKIEVETRNIHDVREACQFPIDIIMLDNMTIEQIEECIAEIRKTPIRIEVSGNITEKNISSYQNLDIDYISMGALTHSVKNFDVSLLLEEAK